jgi:hypothetical protein
MRSESVLIPPQWEQSDQVLKSCWSWGGISEVDFTFDQEAFVALWDWEYLLSGDQVFTSCCCCCCCCCYILSILLEAGSARSYLHLIKKHVLRSETENTTSVGPGLKILRGTLQSKVSFLNNGRRFFGPSVAHTTTITPTTAKQYTRIPTLFLHIVRENSYGIYEIL